jgi:sugar (pentulose or hexulose) kinase
MNLLALDQGTSATKALVVCTERGILAEAETPVHPRAAPGGGVEQDPEELHGSVVEAGPSRWRCPGRTGGRPGCASGWPTGPTGSRS